MPRIDRSVSRRSTIIQLAAVALGGIVPVRSATKPAAPHPLNPRFAGAFVNWGPRGREVTLQGWEKWLNQAPSSVLGVDFYAQSTWRDFYTLDWVPGFWKKLNPARNVVWSVPLTVKGTPLKDVADGLHDARRLLRRERISFGYALAFRASNNSITNGDDS